MTGKIISILSQFPAESHACVNAFCSTCGGLSVALKRNMTPEIDDQIKQEIVKLSLHEFNTLRIDPWNDWGAFLLRNYEKEVIEILNNEAKNVDVEDIRSLDNFLFGMRKYRHKMPMYKDLLPIGIKKAIETRDESLLESLIIILGKYVIEYEELYAVVINEFKVHGSFHRVLYNTVREQEPLVTGYVGDGNTFWY